MSSDSSLYQAITNFTYEMLWDYYEMYVKLSPVEIWNNWLFSMEYGGRWQTFNRRIPGIRYFKLTKFHHRSLPVRNLLGPEQRQILIRLRHWDQNKQKAPNPVYSKPGPKSKYAEQRISDLSTSNV